MNNIEIEQTKEQEICDILYKFMSHCEVEECIELLRPYLQSLQEPTEEREVEIKRGEDSMGICPLCDEYQFPKQKYCSDCGAKINWIE